MYQLLPDTLQGVFQPCTYSIFDTAFRVLNTKADTNPTEADTLPTQPNRRRERGRSMQITLCEFLQKFYPSRNEFVLSGCGAKWKTASFFFENALREDTDPDKKLALPSSEDGYSKWFNGAGNPSPAVFSLMLDSFDEDTLVKALIRSIREGKDTIISAALGISLAEGERPDKRRLAIAITKQFFSIIKGNGSAELIADTEYRKRPEAIGLNTYLYGAIAKYRLMTILGGDEVELDDYYVCNRIGRSPAVFAHLDKGKTIDQATLKALRSFDENTVTNRVILIAASGFGKTLMLQHLFLQAARAHMETGLLPILVELRNFSHLTHDLVSCIVESVTHFGEIFSEEDAKDLLAKGQCQILLDGLDEMDPSEIRDFQLKLSEFVDCYPDNQIVLSSRECDALSGIKRFVKLYIHPFDNDQSQSLIDKLLRGTDDPAAKGKIQQYMDDGFIKKDDIFATNPMLLTFVVQNYQKLDEYAQSRYLFYQEAYEAMLTDHDADKNAFDRIFHSVSGVDEFTLVFREFCAMSYLNADKEFSKASFERYFNQLRSTKEVENPSKLKWRAFLQDACATACMMYEARSKIIYIDPAFQEYLFAMYMYLAPLEQARDLLKPFKNKSPAIYQTLNGFQMFYEMGNDKAEISMFLPFLDLIFRGKTEEEAFRQYLLHGYSEIGITVIDSEKARQAEPAGNIHIIPYVNEPCCIPMLLILRACHLPETFCAGTTDPRIWWEDHSCKQISLNGMTVGHILEIGRDELMGSETMMQTVSEVLKHGADDLYDTFLKVKEYHTQIAKKKRALTYQSEEDI